MSAPTGGEAPPLPAATRGGAAVAGAGSGSGLAGSRDAGAKPSTATSKKATTPDELPPHLRAKYDKLEASYLALLRRAAAFAASEEGKPRHAGPSCEHGAPVPTYDKTKGEVVHEGRGGVAEDGEDGADADADVVAAARRMLPARRPLVLQVDESGGPEELKISTVADPSHSASDGTGRGAEEVKPSPAKRSVETEPLDLVPLELLMQFRALQERRSRTYSAFEEGFRDLLESGSFEPYAELVQRVTAAFAEVSKDVRAIEAALKARGATSEASLLRSIQDQEKAKLHLVSWVPTPCSASFRHAAYAAHRLAGRPLRCR